MNFYTNYKKYIKHKEKTEFLKSEVESEIGKILYKLKMISPYRFGSKNLSINKKIVDKDLCHPFAGMECFEIWETDDGEFARSYVLPTNIFKTKDYRDSFFKLLADYEKSEKKRREEIGRKAKEDREKNDLREYKRLKRKFNNNK